MRAKRLQDAVGSARSAGDRDRLVAAVRLRGLAGAEVDRVDARRPELGDRRPGLLGRDARAPPAAISLRASGFAVATGPDGALESIRSSPCPAHSSAQPRLGLRRAAARRVAEVDVRLGAGRGSRCRRSRRRSA